MKTHEELVQTARVLHKALKVDLTSTTVTETVL